MAEKHFSRIPVQLEFWFGLQGTSKLSLNHIIKKEKNKKRTNSIRMKEEAAVRNQSEPKPGHKRESQREILHWSFFFIIYHCFFFFFCFVVTEKPVETPLSNIQAHTHTHTHPLELNLSDWDTNPDPNLNSNCKTEVEARDRFYGFPGIAVAWQPDRV